MEALARVLRNEKLTALFAHTRGFVANDPDRDPNVGVLNQIPRLDGPDVAVFRAAVGNAAGCSTGVGATKRIRNPIPQVGGASLQHVLTCWSTLRVPRKQH